MDLKTVCIAMFVAAGYITWPNLPKLLNVKPGIVPFIVIIVAFIVTSIISHRDISEIGTIPIKALVVIVVFAAVNGVAIYLCTVTAADKTIQTGMFLSIMVIFQALFAPALDWFITGTKLSLYQYAGLGFTGPVIWLLMQRAQ